MKRVLKSTMDNLQEVQNSKCGIRSASYTRIPVANMSPSFGPSKLRGMVPESLRTETTSLPFSHQLRPEKFVQSRKQRTSDRPESLRHECGTKDDSETNINLGTPTLPQDVRAWNVRSRHSATATLATPALQTRHLPKRSPENGSGGAPATRSRTFRSSKDVSPGPGHNRPTAADIAMQRADTDFAVEKLVAKAKIGRYVYYKVRWTGFPASESSWVKKQDIGPEALTTYCPAQPGKAGVFRFEKIESIEESQGREFYRVLLRRGRHREFALVDRSDLGSAVIRDFEINRI